MNTLLFAPKKLYLQFLTAILVVLLALSVIVPAPVLAADTGLQSPTSCTGWTNPANALSSNNVYATTAGGNNQLVCTFNLPAIPAGAVINGIEVSIEGMSSGSREADVDLSWNAGGNYTGGDPSTTFGGAETTFTLGGAANTWGRAWAIGDFTAANFRVRLTSTGFPTSGTISLDHVRVRVTYSFGTTTTVVSDINPSVSGQTVTFTATVTSTSGTPTGTVNFRDGVTVIGTGALDGSGVATFSTNTLTVGSHNITAVYVGDANFGTSTSAILVQGVNQAPAITSANSTTFSVGTAGNFAVTTTGFPAPTFTLSGDPLPSGVTFNTNTGVFGGTPASGTVGVYNFLITATNGISPDATQNFTLNIIKGNQTINFPAISSPRAYGSSFVINPTASSGLPVTVVASGVCTLAGNTVTMTSGTGTCTLTASQAGDTDYNPAP
ncbi:MAG: Ig-like domain repeat protein, partial [Anaerolineales bacterium]|nr:Ig-like domain repeat protein [Anaerolineales bacterium]